MPQTLSSPPPSLDGDMATMPAGLSWKPATLTPSPSRTPPLMAALNTLDGKTTVGTINASNVTTLTGAAADLNTAYTANDNGSISGLRRGRQNPLRHHGTSPSSTPLTANAQAPSMPAPSTNKHRGTPKTSTPLTPSNGITGLMTRTSPSPTPRSTVPPQHPRWQHRRRHRCQLHQHPHRGC